MRFDEYREYDATGLAELVARKEASATELLEASISAIERRNPLLNAVVHKMYDEGRRLIAAGLPEGPFTGVPFLLKDLLAAYAGVPMSNGTTFYGDFRPTEHSGLVARFLKAGLVVVGKTNTPEFGLLPVTEPPRFGITRNPWDILRTAGGSSGGSAAAVASGMVPMASGGDGGGSIRIPASCCGIFGLKPTRWRNPTSPHFGAWEGFTQEHVLTRSVRDSAAALDATNVFEPGCPAFTPPEDRPFATLLEDAPRRLRIAFSTAPILGRATHADCRSAVEDAVALLRELGHEVVEAAPVIERRAFIQNWVMMIAGQTAADVRRAERAVGRRATQDDFHAFSWMSRVMGEALSAGAYVEAADGLKEAGRRVAFFLDDFDAWLTPTLGCPPLEHGALELRGALAVVQRLAGRLRAGRLTLWSGKAAEAAAPAFDFASFSPLANAGGLPSMSVPLSFNGAGLPIGVLFTGRFGDDAKLLQLARQLEDARPWAGKHPPE